MKDSFHSAIVATWVLILLCLLSFGAMYVLSLMGIDWTDKYFFLVFAFPLFLFCVIFLAMLYSMRFRYNSDLHKIREGDHYVRWTYEEDEWSRFNRSEWERTRTRTILVPLGLVVVFFAIAFFANGFTQAEMEMVAPWIVGFALLLSVVILAYTHMLYRRTLTCPREVVIGPDGVLFGGYYNSWKIVGSRLGGVRFVRGDPSSLEFLIMVWGRYGSSPRPFKVPVPGGHELEAEELVKRFGY